MCIWSRSGWPVAKGTKVQNKFWILAWHEEPRQSSSPYNDLLPTSMLEMSLPLFVFGLSPFAFSLPPPLLLASKFSFNLCTPCVISFKLCTSCVGTKGERGECCHSIPLISNYEKFFLWYHTTENHLQVSGFLFFFCLSYPAPDLLWWFTSVIQHREAGAGGLLQVRGQPVTHSKILLKRKDLFPGPGEYTLQHCLMFHEALGSNSGHHLKTEKIWELERWLRS